MSHIVSGPGLSCQNLGMGQESSVTSLRVAALQLTARFGDNEANNRHAEAFIEKAAGRGAKLVALPEAYSSAYLATSKVWEVAERSDGPTSSWLRSVSTKLGIVLGTGFVETDGDDFYNAYMLSDHEGRIIGLTRKKHAESYAFKSGDGPYAFDSPIGRIGVGICADNQFAFLPRRMREEYVDIMLMPHAAPLRKRKEPAGARGPEYEKIEAQYARMKDLPHRYARMLGVPVVFATQLGTLEKLPGIIGRAMDPEEWWMPGISRIVDSDDSMKAELGDVEGIAIADVALDPARKALARRLFGGRKSFNGFSIFARSVIFPIDAFFARLAYRRSKRALRK